MPEEELSKRIRELRDKGLGVQEIASELHLSTETVEYYLSEEVKGRPTDVKIGWKSIGVFPQRMYNIAAIMADIVEEEAEKREFSVDGVVGIAINGIPFALYVAEILGAELIVYRPHPRRREGLFSSNYATPSSKNLVLVDDVFSTGETIGKAIRDIREEGGQVHLVVVLVNKTLRDEVEGVPLRSLVRARLVV